MPCLRWIQTKGKPTVVPVYKKITTLGSADGNDLVLTGENIAEHHAQILFDGRDFHLSEVESTGHLLVNEKKRRRGKIFHNDQLTLGDQHFIFSIWDEVINRRHGEEVKGVSNTQERSELTGMRSLSDFSKRLNAISSVKDQIEALLDAVIHVTQADKGFVLLLEGDQPNITAARNLQQRNLPDNIRQLSDSIVAEVVKSQQPIIVSDASNDTQFGKSASIMDLKLSSVMCAPLIAQNQLLGVIYVGSDRATHLFDKNSLSTFTVYATQGALLLQNALLRDEITTDRNQLANQLEYKHFGDIIGTSSGVQQIFRTVEKVASTDISVLITGETGTGKELIAREIHNRSPRASRPFVVVNCGAIPESLMESELFGHVKGAFTGAVATHEGKFQTADGGTLFLDEVGEMPLALQVKLLRALQERVVAKVGDNRQESIDIRVLSATNRNLEVEIKKGSFREDLFYRLNVVNLHLPPLRERGEDIVLIAKYLLQKYATQFSSNVKGFTPNTLIAMRKYDWPGNVRQLDNRIKKALVLCDKTMVGPEDMDLFPEALKPVVSLTEAREAFQHRYVMEVLERNNGNRTKTARDLGVDPRTIFRYLEREPQSDE